MVPPTATADALDQSDHGPRKRRRVTLACEECRERKRKCDGVKPTCGACKGRPASQCIWKEGRNSRGWWSNSYVQQLQGRIKELEESRKSPVDPGIPSELASSSPPSARRATEQLKRPVKAFEAADPVNLQSHVHAGVQLPVVDPDSVDMPLPTVESFAPSQPGGPELAVTPLQPPYWDNVTEQPARFARDPQPPHSNSADLPALSTLISPLPSFTNHYRQSPGYHASRPELAALDAMGVARPLRKAEPGSQRRHSDFYGPSSTISLLNQTRSIIGQRSCGQEHRASSDGDSCTSYDDGITVITGESPPETSARPHKGYAEAPPVFEMGIPPRAEADRLINLFWTYVHSLYPFLHWPSFHNRYLELWCPRGATSQPLGSQSPSHSYYDEIDDGLFHCMLNIVLAMGMLHNPDMGQQQQREISYTFFSRAKSLLDLDLLDTGTVPLVQVLLLMGQYLQTRDISTSCWNVVGLAIRVAQGMGLHCNQGSQQALGATYAQSFDQLDVEMRKRAWSGCLLLDRILSLTYGRPLTIQSGFAQTMSSIPSAIDDEILTRSPDPAGSQSEGTNSRIECYVQALKLQLILGNILTSFYNQSSDDKDMLPCGIKSYMETPANETKRKGAVSVAFQKLLEVEDQLEAWSANLPPHLQVSSYSAQDLSAGSPQLKRSTMFCRQAIVLRARFLYVRMLLSRPFLLELCRSVSHPVSASTRPKSKAAALQHSLSTQAGALCVSVAQELVRLIIDWSHRPDLLPPPWYNVLYVYGSALVLSLGSLCLPRLERSNSSASAPIEVSWRSCLDFLRGYESQSQSAPRCIAILERLETESASYTSGTQSPGDIYSTASARRQSQEGNSAIQGAMGFIVGAKGSDSFAPSFDGGLDIGNSWINESSSMNWLSMAPFFEDTGDFLEGDIHATD